MPTSRKLSAVPAVKRKEAPKEDEDGEASGSDSGSDVSVINVDFDFYNLNPDVDQIAVKRLLRQTLSHDEELIDVHPLASLILSEGVRINAGSSIKTDGEESDPWGLVAVVDIHRCRDDPAFTPFLTYLTSTVPSHNPLLVLLSPSISPALSNRPALVFSLRMLNLPLPLVPPLYRMLLSELDEASGRSGEEQVPKFTHWVIWGRGYRLEGSEEGMGLDMHEVGKKSKKKAKGAKAKPSPAALSMATGSFPYHPEEEFIDKVATQVYTYPFKSAPPRGEDSFGVEQFGRLVIVEREKLAKALEAMEEACK